MDNSSPGVENGSPGTRGSNGVRARSPLLHHHYTTVIVHKDDRGYGMKVSGDNPVFVQSVKDGGAAERAGLHRGDTIIKVNGVNVMHSTHTEVVELIKSSNQVALTVQQSPLRERSSSLVHSPTVHQRASSQPICTPTPPRTDRITAPLPVDDETQRQIEDNKVHHLRMMLEDEERNIERLRSALARSDQPDPEVLKEIARSERMVITLNNSISSLIPPDNHQVPPEMPPPLPCRNNISRPPPPTTPPPLPPRQYLLYQADNHSNLHTSSINPAGPQVLTHSHQRTKSSPDSLSANKLAEVSKRLISSESMSDVSLTKKSKGGVGWEPPDGSPRVTPPGTPPPPYGPHNINHENSPGDLTDNSPVKGCPSGSSGQTNIAQHSIISMEDEDMSDQELSQMENHGPFKSLSKLWSHQAHLAVFLNYVISNSDPSSLLFYLVTDLYREGSTKEMKKWAYEIHSSFLVPGAPLRLNNVDENVAREIDDVLLKEADKEEILRRIFWKARQKAKEELNGQLADFQSKRTSGLNTLYGPPDCLLEECIHDKAKEIKVIENILLPKLEPYLEDIEKDIVDDRRFSTGAALGTVMAKVFGIRSASFSTLIERCPTYVSKDKSLKAKFMGRSKKQVTVRGHHCVAHQYYTVTYCNHCQLIIWGIGPQGYQCTNCGLNIHRSCVKVLEENCPGPMVKKEKSNDRISKFMEKIRPENTRRKPSTLNLNQVEKTKRLLEEESGASIITDYETGERVGGGGGSGGRAERRPDPVREEAASPRKEPASPAPQHSPDRLPHHHTPAHGVSKNKSNPAAINRSESYKERIHQKRQLRERRKTSDPNLSKTNTDVELDSQPLTFVENSGSSSNSSLSTRSLESPCNYIDSVSGGGQGAAWDSDIEAEADPPDWTKTVPEDQLKQLSRHEKKRQDVINELFHTERTHVRGLKVLDQVFHRPLKDEQILLPDQVQLLFANLEEVLEMHTQFNNIMKAKRKESPIVTEVASILNSMFDGPEGENFQRAAATFCARQHIALESLKSWRKKDPKVHGFLSDAEANPVCRRLLLKDIISTGWQRLTKYPLLLENLAKYTKEEAEEFAAVQRAIDRAKEILNHVDQAIKEAEDENRLAEIQRRLDKAPFDKVDHPIANEFRNLDLRKHRLIHEGGLNWRIANRPKLIELHVLLLEDVIILLHKKDDKFVLQFYSSTLSPVIKVSTVLVRPNAVEQNGLYLVNTAQNGAQIYELVAASIAEKQKWFKHISEAAEAYKQREGKHRRTEPPSLLSDSLPTDLDKSKQSEDGGDEVEEEGSEEEGSESATAAAAATEATTPPAASPVHPPNKLDGGRRLAEESQLKITIEPGLIEPSEVLVTSSDNVHIAQPVLTPIGKLKRKDEAIRQALAEKQALVADMLNVPQEDFETIADIAGEPSLDKDPAELLLASVNQVNQLTRIMNEALDVGEAELQGSRLKHDPTSRLPSVPAHKLQPITSSLIAYLTQLLVIMPEREEERERLRRELQLCREQLHALHEKQDFSEPSCEVVSQEDEAIAVPQTPVSSPDQPQAPDVFVDAMSGDYEVLLSSDE